jgi:hypothetical protein
MDASRAVHGGLQPVKRGTTSNSGQNWILHIPLVQRQLRVGCAQKRGWRSTFRAMAVKSPVLNRFALNGGGAARVCALGGARTSKSSPEWVCGILV